MAQKVKEKNKESKEVNKLQIVTIALLSLLVVCVIALGAYLFLYKDKGAQVSKNEVNKSIDIKDQVVYPLAESTINLADKEEKRYVKLKVSLGYRKNDKLAKELEAKKDIVSDCILSVVRSKTKENFDGMGAESIKKEIINKINPNLSEGIIEKIYFSELLIQ